MSGALGLLSRAVGAVNGALPGGANASSSSWDLLNDGTYATGDGAGGSLTGNWVTPANAAIAALYEAKVDVTAGAFTAGAATGAWLSLATSRFWTRVGAGTVTFNVSIREAGGGVVRSTQTGLTLVVS